MVVKQDGIVFQKNSKSSGLQKLIIVYTSTVLLLTIVMLANHIRAHSTVQHCSNMLILRAINYDATA